MQQLGHPNFGWFEHNHLRFLYKTLTENWWVLQGHSTPEALEMWLQVLKFLEVDRKGTRDLLGLAQSMEPGRTRANLILWNSCSRWGAKRPYRDISNKISHKVGLARKDFDRPAKDAAEDLEWWTWSCLEGPGRYNAFSPRAVPKGPFVCRTGAGGVPLAPPACWGPPLRAPRTKSSAKAVYVWPPEGEAEADQAAPKQQPGQMPPAAPARRPAAPAVVPGDQAGVPQGPVPVEPEGPAADGGNAVAPSPTPTVLPLQGPSPNPQAPDGPQFQ